MIDLRGVVAGNRVTAGLPGLSPFLRNLKDIREKTRAFSNDCLKEDKQKKEVTTALDGQVDVTNASAQMGRPLSSKQVEQRLSKMNSNLWFETSLRDSTKTGIYVIELSPNVITGNSETHKRFVCGMESAFMPERSVRHYRKKRVPDPDVHGHFQEVKEFTGETRGWRTVLARLLRERLIRKGQIDSFFPMDAGNSANWQALTT